MTIPELFQPECWPRCPSRKTCRELGTRTAGPRHPRSVSVFRDSGPAGSSGRDSTMLASGAASCGHAARKPARTRRGPAAPRSRPGRATARRTSPRSRRPTPETGRCLPRCESPPRAAECRTRSRQWKANVVQCSSSCSCRCCLLRQSARSVCLPMLPQDRRPTRPTRSSLHSGIRPRRGSIPAPSCPPRGVRSSSPCVSLCPVRCLCRWTSRGRGQRRPPCRHG